MTGLIQCFVYAAAIVLAEKAVGQMTGWRDGRATWFVLSAGALAYILVRG